MFFGILIFTLYVIALVVTNKLDISFDFLNKNLGQSMEEYVSSKNPQSTADVEHSIYEYMRKGRRSFH
jgi:hypothetical protein